MPLMHYKAMDERGKTVRGQMEAVNVADLEMRLGHLGLDLLNHTETGRAGARSVQVRREDLIGFCFHMEQLLGAGVPVLEALADLRDSVDRPRLREVIAVMVESIEGGKTLSQALAQTPRVFDTVFVNLVRAGEVSGQVGPVLANMAEHLKWQDEQAALVKRLMTYPLVVAAVVVLVVVFVMAYLVPQLVSFVTAMGEQIPLHTRALIAVSDFFVNYWYGLLALPVVIFTGVQVLKKTSPSFALYLDGFKLRVWFTGPIFRKMILACFAKYFALLYAAGIPVLECIRVCEGLVGNRAIEDATRRAGREIADGASISAGFEATGLFPPLVLRMLRVGESTGALDTSLLNISYFYDRDVKEAILRLQTLIEPAMTLALGAVMAWVIFSVLGPIYDLITKLPV